MKILQHKEPFYHTIIHDLYTDEEVKAIWIEINFLHSHGKMVNHSTLINKDSGVCGSKISLPLDDVYRKYRSVSNILTVNRKIFNIWEQLQDNPFARYLPIINNDSTLLSYYSNKSLFIKHYDTLTLSCITTFWKEPKAFEGGRLQFSNYKYYPDMRPNTMLLFPSFEHHEVSELIMDENDKDNMGRYTINQFMSINP